MPGHCLPLGLLLGLYEGFLHNAGSFLTFNPATSGLAFLPLEYVGGIILAGIVLGFIGSLDIAETFYHRLNDEVYCCPYCCFWSSASSAWGENPKDELKGVKQEIRAKKQLISKTRKVEAVVSTELQEINRNLVQKESDLGRLDRDLRGVEIQS